MRKSVSGFTIVELLIVIVVIAILATISIVAYNGIQMRARDADRAADISQIKKKVEAYYALNGSYPSAYDMANAQFRKDNLDIQDNSLVTPAGSTNTIAYCWPGVTNRYCYSGTKGGTDCSAAGLTDCTGYWIVYRTEADPTTDIVYRK